MDLAYNAAGQYTSIAYYEDLAGTDLVSESTWGYDTAGRLTSLDHDKDTTSLASYDWTFDANGRVTQFVSVDGTTDYTYDDTNQLTAADHDYQTDESYSYDATGNRTNTGYSTGDNNQLLSDGTYDYEYDDEGNRTKKTHSTTGDYVEYDWHHKNRLVAVSFRNSSDTLTKKVVYTYDVYNRLIRRQVDDDGNGTIDRAEAFVYDGDDVVLVFDDSSSLTHRYLHGDAVDQVFADDSISEILWALTDNQGTVRDVVNYDPVSDNSNVANHREFDAFGNITAESDSNVEFRYAYTGRYYDVDSEIQYSRARWLDLRTSRFLSEDPIKDDINLTRYVFNSPTNGIDPSGLFTVSSSHSTVTVGGNDLRDDSAEQAGAPVDLSQIGVGSVSAMVGGVGSVVADAALDGGFEDSLLRSSPEIVAHPSGTTGISIGFWIPTALDGLSRLHEWINPILNGPPIEREPINGQRVIIGVVPNFGVGPQFRGTGIRRPNAGFRGPRPPSDTRPLLGRNPRQTGSRTNTDLPGGRAAARSIFANQTRGQPISQQPLPNGGVRRFAPDGTQIRMNPDGSTRVDLPGRGPRGRETIHFPP